METAGSQAQRMEMWPQGLVWPSLSGLISFQVPLALPARSAETSDAALGQDVCHYCRCPLIVESHRTDLDMRS